MNDTAFTIASRDAAAIRSAMRMVLLDDNGPRFTRVFFTLLFNDAPHLRGEFPADTAGLERKMLATLQVILRHLDQPARLAAEVDRLRAVHPRYEENGELMKLFVRNFRKAYAIVAGAEFPTGAWSELHRLLLYVGLMVTGRDSTLVITR